jgi:predicted O-linked N-acetylglucosamine transferase (SPINDLY family)
VRLPGIAVYYEPSDAMPVDRAQFGLRADVPIFWCGQALYKYLPQFDAAFARIARAVGDCQFVFIEFPGADHVTTAFRRRLETAFAALGLDAAAHCVILPRLEQQQYIASIGCSDVVLDSIGWSGFNSVLESLTYDRPIVTMRGAFMRGRHACAILAMMGIDETIAQTMDDYVSLAARLAADADWRASLGARIAASKHRLYRDRACIDALETFLTDAVRAKPCAATLLPTDRTSAPSVA